VASSRALSLAIAAYNRRAGVPDNAHLEQAKRDLQIAEEEVAFYNGALLHEAQPGSDTVH
jgi:hypothetical protein